MTEQWGQLQGKLVLVWFSRRVQVIWVQVTRISTVCQLLLEIFLIQKWNNLRCHCFPHLHKTKMSDLQNENKIFQKGKCLSSLFWKAFQIRRIFYFSRTLSKVTSFLKLSLPPWKAFQISCNYMYFLLVGTLIFNSNFISLTIFIQSQRQ